MTRRVEIGQRFGRLTALTRLTGKQAAELGKPPGKGSWWRVKCSCGIRKAVRQISLLEGDTRSCGCISRNRQESTQHPPHLRWADV